MAQAIQAKDFKKAAALALDLMEKAEEELASAEHVSELLRFRILVISNTPSFIVRANEPQPSRAPFVCVG